MTRRLQHALLYGSASVLFLIVAISLTPITSPLPPYTGNYEVGVLDLETVVERRVIYDAVLKETRKNAFEVCNTGPAHIGWPSQTHADIW